jgi:hypothetical protein
MKLTETQQEVVDRYYEATKDNPDSRMPVEKLLGMRNKIPKYRPNNYMLKKLEEERINDVSEDLPVTRGRPKKEIVNTVVLEFLSPYFDDYALIAEEYYWLDDIFTGVSRLDLGGNTRDLSKYHLFDLLSVCAKLDVSFVQDYLSVGERQAQKVLMSLGIAHRMLEKEIVDRKLIDGTDLEVS